MFSFFQFSTYISNPNKPLSVAVSCHQISFGDIKNARSVRQVKIYRCQAILKNELNFPLKYRPENEFHEVWEKRRNRVQRAPARGEPTHLAPPAPAATPATSRYHVPKWHVHGAWAAGGLPFHRWSLTTAMQVALRRTQPRVPLNAKPSVAGSPLQSILSKPELLA